MMLCIDCCKRLSVAEQYYYVIRCEECEREAHERIVRWREGGEDKELDFIYSVPKETRQ